MKVLTIAAKTLREAVRQPRSLAITLGLPVAFMLIFGLAFGQPDIDPPEVAVVDLDGSAMSRAYVDGLAGIDLLEVDRVDDEAAAREALLAGRYVTLVIVPAGFAEDATPRAPEGTGQPVPLTQPQTGPAPPRGATVTVVGDPSGLDHQLAAQVVAGYTSAFAEGVTGQKPAVAARQEAVTARELTQFDYIAPGLMVFAILSIAPQAASALARESEVRTLERVRMSPTSALSLLGGVALAHLALSAVSLALMLATARLMGFQNQGSYLLAFAIALGASVAVVGIGMLIASFARTQQEAMGLGTLVSVPASFLSGSFFPVPGVPLWGGVELYDLLPTRHAVQALRQVMTLGRDADAVTGAMGALAALAIVTFAAGVVLYRRTRFAAD